MTTTDLIFRRASRGHRLERGFTVLELMIVLAIAGVLAAIAAPSMIELVRLNRLSAVARQLDADILVTARAIAQPAHLIRPVSVTAGSCGWARWAGERDGSSATTDQDNDCDATVAGNPNRSGSTPRSTPR